MSARHWHVAQNRHPTIHGEPWGAVEAVRHPAGGAGSPPAGMRPITWTGEPGKASARLIVDAVNDYDQLRADRILLWRILELAAMPEHMATDFGRAVYEIAASSPDAPTGAPSS